MVSARTGAPGLACTLALGVLWSLVVGVSATAAEDRKALLLLPVASGTPGQEWSAKALGGILDDGFGSLRSIRLVAGTAREVALRELSASATMTPEEFREICRRAGADLAVLGGSTLVEGRLALEIRSFDVGAARELQTFRGEEPLARAFNLIEAAVRHVAAEAALGGADSLFPRGVTVSLEAYAAYRAALAEESPALRVEKLRGVLKLDANYADPTMRLGVELFRQGSLDEALVVLERAVALGPKTSEARNNYGVALAAAGRPEQAQREFEEAVSLSPDYAEARLNLARVFEDRGRSSDAERQYTAVLEADAGNDKARSRLAALYDGTGRPELAIKEFRLLSARRPDLAEAEFIIAGQEARKAREYARAEKFFLRATDINPQFAQAWAELGTNSYLAGEFPKSVEFFRKALSIDPGQAAFHYYLALALDKGRQQDEALREYRRAVELGGPPEARLGLARAALVSGDPGLAVEELNRLLVAAPDHAEAKMLLVQATSEMEARRRLVEGQSQFANQRLARLEQIVADANRANRELEARLQSVSQEKRLLEKMALRERAAGQGELEESPPAAAVAKPAPPAVTADPPQADLALLRAEKDRLGRELATERERFKREAERLEAELAAAQAKSLELGRGSGESEELRQRLAGLQADQARSQTEFSQEREQRLQEAARLKTELSVEREARRVEAERSKADLAATEVVRGELAKKADEAAEYRGQVLAAQGAASRAEDTRAAERERADKVLAAEREQGAGALAAERATRREEVEKLKAEVAALQARAQERDQAVQERDRLAKELVAAGDRERERAVESAKSKADLEVLAGRQVALEARAVAEARTLAEWERTLEKTRLEVRDLALELGRIALRTQAWEKARGYLEQAAETDPRSAEAWYGLGEALFELGQYEKSKQMYEKAKKYIN